MGKVIFVIGATGGIGRAICSRLASEGYSLRLVARDVDALESLKDELLRKYRGVSIEVYTCDISCADEVEAQVGRWGEKGERLYGLVLAAGIAGGGLTAEIAPKYWDSVIATNLSGVFYVVKSILAANLMVSDGRIITIASTGGKQGVIYAAPYCASKHGVIGLTKALAQELARDCTGITVNAVCPGFVETAMACEVRQYYASLWGVSELEAKERIEARVPLGRYIEPEEVAGMVAYLASQEASGVTGQALNVCGGLGNY